MANNISTIGADAADAFTKKVTVPYIKNIFPFHPMILKPVITLEFYIQVWEIWRSQKKSTSF